jgi:hypothetical protein
MADILRHHSHLRFESFVPRIQADQLLELPFDDMVLLEVLEDIIGGTSDLTAGGRVQDPLFDNGMSGQVGDDLIDQLALGLVCRRARLGERLEQPVDFSVICLQEGNGIQRRWFPGPG